MSLSQQQNTQSTRNDDEKEDDVCYDVKTDNNAGGSGGGSESSSDGSVCSSTEDSETSDEFKQFKKRKPPIYSLKMLNSFKDAFLLMLVVVVTYAALINEPPKIAKSPAAYPFFDKDSPVVDWYRGHLSKAIEYARTSDIAFVMFYAPWDAESQRARRQFEATARYMDKFVTFVAVNCWHPSGECRNSYSKVYGWPVFIVYLTQGHGIQYNGPIRAEYMIKFLMSICWPLRRFPKDNLLEYQDAFITVNIDPSPGNLDYAVLYSTALRHVQKDPFQKVPIYVLPEAPNSPPLLKLHMWNETLIYPNPEKSWRPDAILSWLYKHLHLVSKWVAPSGSKSSLLSNSLVPGPALVLFTPFNPLQSSMDYYDMLQEIAEEYYSCDNSVNATSSRITSKRIVHLLKYQSLKAACRNTQPDYASTITTSSSFWANNSNCLLKICNTCQEVEAEICTSNNILRRGYRTSIIKSKNDPKSVENLAKLLYKEQCRQFFAAAGYHSPVFVKNDDSSLNITGMACKFNESLGFVAVDSLNYYHFAEKLGINLWAQPDKTAAVIVDNKMETHYIMDVPITTDNLRAFIKNFTENQLERSRKSLTWLKSKHTHTYRLKPDKSPPPSEVCVEELNSKTFLPTIHQQNKALVVFYYSKQCSYCNGFAYIFLTVAKKLQYIPNVQFARIDGEENVLPWEFTMESFPTIIFFPTNRKSDSVAFPITLQMNVPNLLGFILTNLEPHMKLHAMWSICNGTKKFQQESKSCAKQLQAETLAIIERTLREWRKANARQKQILLYRLKQLKQLHLLFAHSPKQHKMIEHYFVKLSSSVNLPVD